METGRFTYHGRTKLKEIYEFVLTLAVVHKNPGPYSWYVGNQISMVSKLVSNTLCAIYAYVHQPQTAESHFTPSVSARWPQALLTVNRPFLLYLLSTKPSFHNTP